jgi:acetyl esterase/lipase
MKKLRILCLHGYHGNADILRAQMAALVDGTESFAEYIVVDAPSLARGDYGWWHAVEGSPTSYEGWSRTREWLVSLFEDQGPFDGVFGFSQGAALAGLLVGLRSPSGTTTPEHPLQFDFAVVVSGFRSTDPTHAAIYASREEYALPSLHLIGRSDVVVPPNRSQDLAWEFGNATIVEHAGGHVIASTPEVRDRYRCFLETMFRRRTESFVDVPLWPGRDHPAMRVVFPAASAPRPRPAMVILQGGGYATSSGSGGGTAEWLATQGIVGVRVEYRTREGYPANYADAARAVRLVRRRAEEWNLDANRIGVVGYSAGGHLASLLSTRPDLHHESGDDLVGRVSARPDLVVLAYPLISFVEGYRPGAFVGSTENFFGRPDVDLPTRREFSNELHVDPTHPPVFIWTTGDDLLVPCTHSKLFVEACRKAGVPVAFQLYAKGPHGLGLDLGDPGEIGQWTTLLLGWLADRWARSAQQRA